MARLNAKGHRERKNLSVGNAMGSSSSPCKILGISTITLQDLILAIRTEH